jgi:hypothetical protein
VFGFVVCVLFNVFLFLGKTTLLSLLAGQWKRQQSLGNLTGQVSVKGGNGIVSERNMKRFIANVQQDDVLLYVQHSHIYQISHTCSHTQSYAHANIWN